MKQVNMKNNYILPHFIKFFYRASPVAASGHLHYFLQAPVVFYKKTVLIILNILRKIPPLGLFLIKFMFATSLKKSSNTDVFL